MVFKSNTFKVISLLLHLFFSVLLRSTPPTITLLLTIVTEFHFNLTIPARFYFICFCILFFILNATSCYCIPLRLFFFQENFKMYTARKPEKALMLEIETRIEVELKWSSSRWMQSAVDVQWFPVSRIEFIGVGRLVEFSTRKKRGGMRQRRFN